MLTGKALALAAFALALVLGTPGASLAAEPHSHDASAALKLDNGNKWRTDDALRSGMDNIRKAMATSLKPIHNNTFSVANYESLAVTVQSQVDHIVANCKLPEDADQQLHLVLEQMLDGIHGMTASAGRQQGAIKIVQALDAYGKHFDHAGWKPLAH